MQTQDVTNEEMIRPMQNLAKRVKTPNAQSKMASIVTTVLSKRDH